MMIKYNDINCNKKKLNLLKFYSAVFQSKFKENSPLSGIYLHFMYTSCTPPFIHFVYIAMNVCLAFHAMHRASNGYYNEVSNPDIAARRIQSTHTVVNTI